MTIFSEQYDFTISLLSLENRDHYVRIAPDAEPNTYDQFAERR
jgi:hypothetical protein